jgi:hypothetical protein
MCVPQRCATGLDQRVRWTIRQLAAQSRREFD